MNYSAISRRFLALVFDNFIIGGIFYGVLMILRISGMNIFPLEEILEGKFTALTNFYMISAIIYLIYEVGFLCSNLSATPGKLIMEMEVVCSNASFLKVLVRSLIKFIFSMTGLSIIFFTFAIFTEKKQAVHDILAGSFVIDQDKANSGAMDLTKDITKSEAFYEEMRKRGIKTFSEQKALAEEMYGKAKKSSTNSIASNSFIWVLVLVISIGVSFVGGKTLAGDIIEELKTTPPYRANGVVVDESIAEKYVGTWANDKRTVGFTVYYVKRNKTMYINTSKSALSFMFDSDNVLYIFEGENKFKVSFSSNTYDSAYMTGPINSQLESKYLLRKE